MYGLIPRSLYGTGCNALLSRSLQNGSTFPQNALAYEILYPIRCKNMSARRQTLVNCAISSKCKIFFQDCLRHIQGPAARPFSLFDDLSRNICSLHTVTDHPRKHLRLRTRKMLSRVASNVARSLAGRGSSQASTISNVVRSNWSATAAARPGVTSTPIS